MTNQGEQDQQSEPQYRESHEERGGEAACWAHLVCPECGAMESEGHRPGCPVDRPRSRPLTGESSAEPEA